MLEKHLTRAIATKNLDDKKQVKLPFIKLYFYSKQLIIYKASFFGCGWTYSKGSSSFSTTQTELVGDLSTISLVTAFATDSGLEENVLSK